MLRRDKVFMPPVLPGVGNLSESSWHIIAAWLVAIAALFLLSAIRVETNAAFTFATAMIFPVLALAWFGGLPHGMAGAILAVGYWFGADLLSGKYSNEPWVPGINCLTRLCIYLLIVFLTAKVRMLLMREYHLARHDSLTGLLNRRALLESGEREAERSMRYHHSMSIIFIDLDNFKNLNDSQGHDVGDRALRVVAETLEKSLRRTDYIGRIGGDEFVVILPEIGVDEAVMTGAKILDAIHLSMTEFPPVTASVGEACYETVDSNFSSMLKNADALMYEIKSGGKGGVKARECSLPKQGANVIAAAGFGA